MKTRDMSGGLRVGKNLVATTGDVKLCQAITYIEGQPLTPSTVHQIGNVSLRYAHCLSDLLLSHARLN